MATSGSSDYTRTRSDIVKRAYRKCNATGLGQTPSADEMSVGVEALNSMIKHWRTQGLKLWKEVEAVLFLENSKESYDLGSGGDQSTLASDFVGTTLGGDEAAAQTVLTLASTTGMTAADVIGIVLDDDTLDWTTIVSVDDTETVTVTTGLTSAASSGNRIYTYTTLLARPLKCRNFRYRDEASAIETPFAEVISREEYMRLPNKDAQGIPTEAYYDPLLATGKLYMWPTADTVSSTVRFTIDLPIEDFDAAANTPDMSSEWYDALACCLAEEMLTEFGVPEPTATRIERKAAIKYAELKAWDADGASVHFQYDAGP